MAGIRSRANMLPRFGALVCAVLAAWLVASSCLAFVAPSAFRGRASRHELRTRHIATVVVEDAVEVGGALAEAKEALLDLVSHEALAQEVLRPEGKPMRGRVDEAILALEAQNPTEEPAYSELIDGEWTVKYTGSYAPGFLSSPTRELALFLYGGGYSLGAALSSFVDGYWGQTLGMKLGEKKVSIKDGRDVEASADLKIAGRQDKYTYKAELLPLSSRRLSEEIVELNFPEPLGKRDVPIELRRAMLITFVDKEVMIVRDESGIPEILVRASTSATPVPVEAAAETPAPAPAPEPASDATVSEAGDDPLTRSSLDC